MGEPPAPPRPDRPDRFEGPGLPPLTSNPPMVSLPPPPPIQRSLGQPAPRSSGFRDSSASSRSEHLRHSRNRTRAERGEAASNLRNPCILPIRNRTTTEECSNGTGQGRELASPSVHWEKGTEDNFLARDDVEAF
ncbi:hypothetical protein Landi51_09365 [Colletotrichum acutatum]